MMGLELIYFCDGCVLLAAALGLAALARGAFKEMR